jgi:hypothetical protein
MAEPGGRRRFALLVTAAMHQNGAHFTAEDGSRQTE